MAQETTAAIQGTITDSSGAALPGVTVEAVNTRGQRYTTVSDAQGHYRFPAVPSGVYNVTATLAGMEPASVKNLEVRLGQSPRVDLQMRLGVMTESVTVTAEAPLVDVTQSSTSVSIAREQIELIPKGRDFTSVVGQAAGASNEAFLGGISIDGASGAENRYVIDGIDTTHPENGVSAQDIVTDFVEEVQVKTAGYAAEFGGSLGGVINAVTKSGSNEFHGSVLGYLTDSAWGGKARPTYYPSDPTFYRTFKKDDNQILEAGLTLGGPVLRDRMWFFLGYNPQFQEINRTPSGSNTTFTQEIDQYYVVGNLTGNVGSKFVYRGSVNINPYERTGVLPREDNLTPASADLSIKREIPTSSWSLHGDYVPTGNLAFTARYGQFSTDVNDSGLDATSQFVFVSPTSPAPFIPNTDPRFRNAGFVSVPTFFQTERDKWDRESAAVSGTYFLNALGSHEFKAGVQFENIKNDVLDQEVGNNFRIRWNTTRLGVRGTYGSVEVRSFQTIGSAESKNTGLFIQDSWQVIPNLVLNVGVRAEEEKIPNYPVNQAVYGDYAWQFDYADKFAPRLGFAWDVFGNQKVRAYGSYGKYYDITKLAMPRGSFGADRWIAFIYPLNTLDWETLDDSCHKSTNSVADNPCPGLGAPGTTRDFRLPTNPAEAIDPDLRPMSQREYQLGFDYSLNTRSMFGVRFVDKSLLDTIEDIGFLVEDSPGVFNEHFITGNPGKGVVAGDPPGKAPAQPEAVRDYQALELTYNRRFVDNWSLRASYTYSKLEGNYSGLASSDEFGRNDPNIERYFDSLINGFDDQGNLVIGPLNTDRPHAVEVQGLYRIPFGTTFGVNTSWRSGTPVSEEIGYLGVPFFPNGRGNLGRTPSLSQTDLLITQPFTIRNYTLEASLNVLNLFDQDTVTRIGNVHYVEDLCEDIIGDDCDHTVEQFFQLAPFDANALMAAGGAQVQPSFGRPLAFQAGRAVRVGLRFIF